jgi:hypothetical protein
MLHRFAAPLIAALLLAPMASAQEAGSGEAATAAEIERLFEALALPEMIGIMAEEGTEYGLQIAQDLIPGGISADWTQAVNAIYDTDRMEAEVQAAFTEAMTGVDIEPMLAFFEAEPGQTIISLEVSARRALLDDAVEEASKEMAAIAMADQTDRFGLIEEFVRVNDLIETNIVGALNSNFAFYTGLATGGAFGQTLTEDQILADVWSQEPQIRQNTTEWVYSFLLMAYQPLSDADVEAYIAFSETEAGKELNKAVFAAFDGMFEDISLALGAAAAAQMITQEL